MSLSKFAYYTSSTIDELLELTTTHKCKCLKYLTKAWRFLEYLLRHSFACLSLALLDCLLQKSIYIHTYRNDLILSVLTISLVCFGWGAHHCFGLLMLAPLLHCQFVCFSWHNRMNRNFWEQALVRMRIPRTWKLGAKSNSGRCSFSAKTDHVTQGTPS